MSDDKVRIGGLWICVVALWLASQPLDDETALDMAVSYVEAADADPFAEGEL